VRLHEPTSREGDTMRKMKPRATRWHDGTTPIDELEPNERLAHEMVSRRGDLAPSVDRIMTADLTADQRNHALLAFHDSLNCIGDENRDPRTAIANAASMP
jgi:hypothetical protein